VVKITENVVEYRKSTQLDGPIQEISINDVHQIVYENGTFEIFETGDEFEKIGKMQSQLKAPSNSYENDIGERSEGFKQSIESKKIKTQKAYPSGKSEISLSFGYGKHSNEHVKSVYSKISPAELRASYFLIKRLSLGAYIEFAREFGKPGEYNTSGSKSEFKYFVFGPMINAYIGDNFYLLGRIGLMKCTEHLSVLSETTSEPLKLIQASAGFGSSIKLIDKLQFFAEFKNNWIFHNEFELEGFFDNWALSGGLSMRF
jgi:hypothetical protein